MFGKSNSLDQKPKRRHVLIPLHPSFQLTTWVAGQMIVWVKSTGEYSVEMINILPTGVQAFAIVVGIVVPSFAM